MPVATEYFSSRMGLPSLLRITLPSSSTFFTQFLRSTPIPPVTPTVVWKIGEIPLVPATIGAILTKGTYGLACSPIHRATLLIPDIREESTPMVPFSAIIISRLLGCWIFSASISFWALTDIKLLPCNSRSARECASAPGDIKSVEISPSAATNVTILISPSISGRFVKNSASE